MSTSVDAQVLKALSEGKIYFGHQSVGRNILDGVASLETGDRATALRIVDLEPATQLDTPAIYHSRIGKNRSPESKIAAFEELLVTNGLGHKVDVALMKLCYVDIGADTDVKKIFEDYTAAIQRIQTRFPKLTIVHATVPLTVHGGGLRKTLRNWVKGDLVNVNREKYNKMVRDRFAPTGIVFDVAAAESTRPNGSRENFKHQGAVCYAAFPEYTDGVGHLNEAGGRHVAAELLRTLAKASPRT